MPGAATIAAAPTRAVSRPEQTPKSQILVPVFGLAAAWIAAGSTGLLGHPLRHALALFFLGVAGFSGFSWNARKWSSARIVGWIAAVVAVLAMSASHLPAINIAAVAVLLAALAWDRRVSIRDPLSLTAVTIFAFALYRFTITGSPWLWLAADSIGAGIVRVVGFLSRSPLNGGATFAGLDFLFVTGALVVFWGVAQAPARRKRILWLVGILLAAHLVYLAVLSWAPAILQLLPPPPATTAFGTTPPWDWRQGLRSLIPWNIPALAGVLHLCIAAFILRTLPIRPIRPTSGARMPASVSVIIIVLAALLPLAASFHPQKLSLAGKKVVLYEKGFLNWMKPKHGEYGRLSVGMYGMLPLLLQSYGATCIVSPELSEADMQGADVLGLIFPNKPWMPGQLERIENFVRNGGSLLVLGEHTVLEKEGGNRFNDVLKPTAMKVAFDSATFEIGGWLESYEALSHPMHEGLTDERNQFGVVIGASVETRWPARPILIGRWGFNDPGDASNDESKGGSMMGNHKYDPGERLGDLILASEQPFGRGRIIAFGDTSGFSNSILFGSHNYVSRVFAYLANPSGVSTVRLWIVLLVFAALMVLVWKLASTTHVILATLAFSISLAASTAITHRRAEVLPDGRSKVPNRIAYIDHSHLERNSSESWRPNGLGGLQMTLMRDDYVTLGLDDFAEERLQRAGLLVSVAPSRKFSSREITALRNFIEGGGIFICTVGYPEAAGSRDMLAEFGFYVGGPGAFDGTGPEPKPFGHFKAPYFNGGDYMAYVRFHAAWHVESSDPTAQPIAYGPRDPRGQPDQRDPSVILMRRIGRGKMVVVADSDFATNQNLEREGGEPFEGMRENADFWRWLLTYLNDQQVWRPPKPAPPAPAPETTKPSP